MADHLEARRHVLELLGDVLADLAQSAAARGATTRLAVRVVVRRSRLGTTNQWFTRQVRRQASVDSRVVGQSLSPVGASRSKTDAEAQRPRPILR